MPRQPDDLCRDAVSRQVIPVLKEDGRRNIFIFLAEKPMRETASMNFPMVRADMDWLLFDPIRSTSPLCMAIGP